MRCGGPRAWDLGAAARDQMQGRAGQFLQNLNLHYLITHMLLEPSSKQQQQQQQQQH
jgi:hypothetical protein